MSTATQSHTETETDTTPGIFSWNELMTRDPAASTKFYTALFGWTSETKDMNGMSYTFFNNQGKPAAGMLKTPKEAGDAPTHWMGFVTVPNLRSAISKAKSLGA